MRKIIHLDMDAFYASVEQRDQPQLRGRPVIVGGDPQGRGVVAACSYEARRFGIHSAMPASRAQRLCPEAVFLRPRFDVYRAISRRILALYREVTPLVQPLSLDEAYLDVSGATQYGGSAARLARALKQRVLQHTGLTVSAGVSYNKFLAKIASDMDKPDGLYVITPAQGEAFVHDLPVRRFHGIGRATEAKMQALGIYTGADLRLLSRESLVRHFGKAGLFYHDIARGVDHRPVLPGQARKSVGSETTLSEDTGDIAFMLQVLGEQAQHVTELLQQRGLAARTLTLKVKYHDFRQVTRSRSLQEPFQDHGRMLSMLPELLARTRAGAVPVRLLGVSVSGLTPAAARVAEEQLDWI